MKLRVQIVCPGCGFFTDTWIETSRLVAFVAGTQSVHAADCFIKTEEIDGQEQEVTAAGGTEEGGEGSAESSDPRAPVH